MSLETAEAAGERVVDEVLDKFESSGWINSNTKIFLQRIAIAESRFGNHKDTYRSGYNGGIWQVDEDGFNDTQNTKSHPGLVKKFSKVKELFGVDWNTVTWSDLRKPLHSAIAARLFLSNVPAAIPTSLEGQAEYWKTHYNKTGKGSGQAFIDRVGRA